MKEFDVLKNKVKVRSNKDTNLLMFCEDKDIDKSIEDYIIDYKLINKDVYTFRLFTYEKQIPVKKENFRNKLDYTMEKYYFLKLYINNDKDVLEMTIDRKETKNDIHILYLEYLDKINFLQIDELFSHFSDIIK